MVVALGGSARDAEWSRKEEASAHPVRTTRAPSHVGVRFEHTRQRKNRERDDVASTDRRRHEPDGVWACLILRCFDRDQIV